MRLTSDTIAATSEAIVKSAEADAEAFACASDVTIRMLSEPSEMEAASGLLAEIWQMKGTIGQFDPGVLVALAHAHNYVAGAYRGTELVGVCVGFFHPPPKRALHSHIAGVRQGNAGVGKALKYHERAWCLRHDAAAMTWTFDPLIARNAFFNLHRLGAAALEYLPNFYGVMTDNINRGQESDRMLLEWDLEVVRGVAGARGSAADREGRSSHGGSSESYALRNMAGVPQLDLDVSGAFEQVRVEIPSDIETMRVSSPAQADLWRPALRTALTHLMNNGWRVTDFARQGHYCLERTLVRANS